MEAPSFVWDDSVFLLRFGGAVQFEGDVRLNLRRPMNRYGFFLGDDKTIPISSGADPKKT